jgi:long-chain acyl-CoA synthetase
MARRTLLDFFADLANTRGEFLVYDDGYRTWAYTYAELARLARAFAGRLQESGIGRDDTIAIWSENRPEWVAALWGALLRGTVVVPIDYRASADFLVRVAAIVKARAILAGDVVDTTAIHLDTPIWKIVELRSGSGAEAGAAADVNPETTAEIIFTSGATADPKGVVISHRNVLANIVPIEQEMQKYKKYARPFLPLRFLNLLPLSHMFGQAMATFVPPMLPGTVIFTRSYAPEDIVRQIRQRRVSVLVCVPKMLEVLRDHVARVAPEAADPPAPGMHWMRRWWRYRRIHRMFGFKFWAMVVGAAPLDAELEAFWGRLGFLVVQGYGLTETAPIVTLNHPMHAAHGAVGKPIAGVEVKIAEDGEILVRGDNVTRGYFNAPAETRAAFEDGWFHTGDIGELDRDGQLRIRGRKKEMIVTPEGLNVFPEDVERAINEQPGVRDSAVIGARIGGASTERVQAVVLLEPGTDLDAVVRGANARLQDHQKIRAAVAWPGSELPRTEGTRKLKRRDLKQWIEASAAPDRAGQDARVSPQGPATQRSVAAVLERFAPGRTMTPETTIDELGLSSLERVEVMMALEDAFQVTVDEAKFAAANTVRDLEALTRPLEVPGAPARQAFGAAAGRTREAAVGETEAIAFPSWNRSLAARIARRASLPTWILPLGRIFARVTVEGLEHLGELDQPVIFAANHQSHMDAPVILDSLPARWRYRVAPAMAKEFFKPHFYPKQFGVTAWFTNSLNYYLSTLFFNAFPLPQREAGTRQTLRYIGELISDGYSVLIFPEGRRTEHGEINRFQPGVGMIAARLEVPVVPVRLEGLDRVLHHSWRFPAVGHVRVAFGRAMLLKGSDYVALTAQLEEAVRNL